MGWMVPVGLLLLGCGPLLAIFGLCISRKSFLTLLSIASAFYWMLVLFVIAAIFRAWAPLPAAPGPYALFLLVAVLVQELARVGVWRFHRASLPILNRVARERGDLELSAADHFSLALTHGFGHAAVHGAFLFAAWVPLTAGGGTHYTPSCPQMSFFLASAASTLAMSAVLTGGMILWLNGLECERLAQAAAAPASHAAAAALTLLNLADGGCRLSIPLLLACGAAVAAYAAGVWWRCTTARAPSGLMPARRAASLGVALSPDAGRAPERIRDDAEPASSSQARM